MSTRWRLWQKNDQEHPISTMSGDNVKSEHEQVEVARVRFTKRDGD
jgi:hypothetical protein